MCNGKKFRAGHDSEQIPVPPGAQLDCQYFFIPWINEGKGRIAVRGPEGRVDFSVGPISSQSNDFLRGFRVNGTFHEILTAEMGRRGGGFWADWVSLALVFDEDMGARFVILDAYGANQDALDTAGQILVNAAPMILAALVTKILG